MNETVFRILNDAIKIRLFDGLLPCFSERTYAVIPLIVCAGIALYLGNRRIRIGVLAAVIAVGVADYGSEKVIKNIFQIQRPYIALENVHLYRHGEWYEVSRGELPFKPPMSNSFPSSHASNVAALAVVLACIHRRTLAVTLPLMLLVGLSRIYTGNHYPTDVLAGYAWGALCGFAAHIASNLYLKRYREECEAIPAAMSQERRVFLGVLAAWTLFNYLFVCLSILDLAPEEAQYWDWSRRLALGYYSKPPMIAYMIRLLTDIGGNQEWVIRSGAILLTSASILFVYGLTARIARSDRVAFLSALSVMAIPATWAGSVLMTTDAPLVFFWAAAMYSFYRAVNGEVRMWPATGLAMGLGTLSKYTMLFLAASFVLYLVLFDRRWFRTRWPYLASVCAGACLSGVIYWNWSSNWASLRHTVAIGGSQANTVSRAAGHFAEFWGGQLGVASPLLFGLFMWAIVAMGLRSRVNRDCAFLFLCFLPIFGGYALASLFRAPYANWPVCAYIATGPALACIWMEKPRSARSRRFIVVALVLGCAVGVFARSTELLYLVGVSINPKIDPTNELRGGREIGRAISKYISDDTSGPFPFSNRYQITALSAYYGKNRPRAYCLNLGDRRLNQYDIWDGWSELAGRDGIFVTGGDRISAEKWIAKMIDADMFESGEVLETIEVRRGSALIRNYTLSRLYRCTGVQPTVEKASY